MCVSIKYYFLAILMSCLVKADVFTAMADIERTLSSTVTAEKIITSAINEYIASEQERLRQLKTSLTEYTQRNRKCVEDGPKQATNPINVFLLIKSLVSDYDIMINLMRNNPAETFIRNITQSIEQENLLLPNSDDFVGAGMALLRLQDTYRLAASDLAMGKIQGIKRANELNAHDSFSLGRIAYNERDYRHCLTWMQEALNRLETELKPSVDQLELVGYLATCLYHNGYIQKALDMTKRLILLDPKHSAGGKIKLYEEEIKRKKQANQSFDHRSVNSENFPASDNKTRHFEALCRGELNTGNTNPKLSCYYKSDQSFLKVAPIKVEIVHLFPLAIIFRDVITDGEINVLKRIATPKLRRARVRGGMTEGSPSRDRIAKSVFLPKNEHRVLQQLFARAHQMTNLDMEASESLQIANYGIGGHYVAHYDHVLKTSDRPRELSNNRIATILLYGISWILRFVYVYVRMAHVVISALGWVYKRLNWLLNLSQPEAGGATVFVDNNLTVFPTIFWYNLLQNGQGDMRTNHGACPVLAGDKWVANFWIHERGQEFIRRCSTEENSDESYIGEL